MKRVVISVAVGLAALSVLKVNRQWSCCTLKVKLMATDSTRRGSVNKNGQVNLGRTDPERAGSGPRQYVYVMHCLECKQNYGSNGADIWERMCPFHAGGSCGERLEGDESTWRPETG